MLDVEGLGRLDAGGLGPSQDLGPREDAPRLRLSELAGEADRLIRFVAGSRSHDAEGQRRRRGTQAEKTQDIAGFIGSPQGTGFIHPGGAT